MTDGIRAGGSTTTTEFPSTPTRGSRVARMPGSPHIHRFVPDDGDGADRIDTAAREAMPTGDGAGGAELSLEGVVALVREVRAEGNALKEEVRLLREDVAESREKEKKSTERITQLSARLQEMRRLAETMRRERLEALEREQEALNREVAATTDLWGGTLTMLCYALLPVAPPLAAIPGVLATWGPNAYLHAYTVPVEDLRRLVELKFFTEDDLDTFVRELQETHELDESLVEDVIAALFNYDLSKDQLIAKLEELLSEVANKEGILDYLKGALVGKRLPDDEAKVQIKREKAAAPHREIGPPGTEYLVRLIRGDGSSS